MRLRRRSGRRLGPAAPQRQTGYEGAPATGKQRASPDKIGNRRGPRNWFRDAELERRTETHRPVWVAEIAIERPRVVDAQGRPKQVDADRPSPAAQQDATIPRRVARAAAGLELRAVLPGDTGIVEDRPFERWEADRKESERERSREGEPQLDIADGDTGADQLVQGRAPGGRGPRDPDDRSDVRDLPAALVVDQRHRSVTPNQVGVAEKDGELRRIAADAAVRQRADRERERPGEEVLPQIHEAAGEAPAAQRRRDLGTVARARERSHETEQRVVVGEGEGRRDVPDRRPGDGLEVVHAQEAPGLVVI